MTRSILAALIIANALVIAGIARADAVQACQVDAKGNLVGCSSVKLSPVPVKVVHATVR
jgi:hypothetical protein